jgi:hypothetical protein
MKELMKNLIAVVFGCMLAVSATLAAEPSAADQKWLSAVEKMVQKGERRVSTPIEARANLLQEWAGKQGYTAQVKKEANKFTVQLSSKGVASK